MQNSADFQSMTSNNGSVEYFGAEMRQKNKKQTLTEQLVRQITGYIRKNNLKSGDPLPTESEMVKRFKVSRVALREAFCYLKGLGLIVSRRGSCLRVANPGVADVIEGVISKICLPEANIVNELFELRRTLELGCIADAVENASEADLRAIEEARLEFERLAAEEKLNPTLLDEAEVKFHYALFSPAGCRILGVVIAALREFFNLKVTQPQDALWYSREKLKQLCEEHRKIAEAFLAHSPEAAFSAVRKHLNSKTYSQVPFHSEAGENA